MVATVTVAGVTLRVPSTGELTLGEWRWLKQQNGLTVVAFELALADSDPDAWWGIMAVGARRDGIELDELDGVNLLEVIEAIQAAAEASETDGPEGNAGSGENPALTGDDVPAGRNPATTPDGSGPLLSHPSTTSIPG